MKHSSIKMAFTFILLALFTYSAVAQNTALTSNPRKAKQRKLWLGAHAGMTSSMGFSARYIENKVGIMVTAFPIYSQNTSFVTVGLTPSYLLKSKKYFDISAFASGAASNINLSSRVRGYHFHTGVGLDFDLKVADSAMLQLLLGYGVRNADVPSLLLASPTIGAGLYVDLFGE